MRFARSTLIALLGALASAVGGFTFGHHAGAIAQQAHAADKTIGELSTLLDANRRLIQDSQSASREMREAVARRAEQDRKSTRELCDALAQTARNRADCRFDAGSMRVIQTARDHAATAAARGIRGTMPAAAGAGRQ